MKPSLKKFFGVLASLFVALLLVYTAPLPAGAEEPSSEAVAVSEKISELKDAASAGSLSDADSEGVVLAEFDNPSDADSYLEGLSDEDRLCTSVRVEMAPSNECAYSIVVYPEPVWQTEEDAADAPGLAANLTIQETLKDAWADLNQVVYVKNYGLKFDKDDDVRYYGGFTLSYYQAVLNNPEQFNVVTSFECTYDKSTKVVTQVKPFYLTTDAAKYESQRKAYEAKINEALATIPCGASDVAKVYLLHNWICEHAAYNETDLYANIESAYENGKFLGWDKYVNPYIFTSYGMIVNGLPVCQGYALALSDMLNRVGIENQELHVFAHSHDWNLVKVDGSWYHVDVTWDNRAWENNGNGYGPGKGCYDYNYFLRSDSGINGGNAHESDSTHVGDWNDISKAWGWQSYMKADNTQYDNVENSREEKIDNQWVWVKGYWDSYDPTAGTTSEHSWDSGVVTTEPTCSTTGIKTYTCTSCKVTKTETIAVKGGNHTYGNWKTVNAPSCIYAGMKERACTKCGSTQTAELAATGVHSWDAGKVNKQATCTEKGSKTYACTVCKATKTEAIAAKGHSWSSWKTTKTATCKEAGSKQRSCTVCKTKQTESIAKTNKHTWDSGKVTTQPTSSKKGTKTFTCTVCGTTKTEAIAALGKIQWARLYGQVRYDTMQKIAGAGWSSSKTVVLASGGNFPDALAASALAGTSGCPVLLTDPSSLSSQARSEIKRLGATKVYIVGGSAAVSTTVESQVKQLGCTTERLSGATRQDTALKIADKVHSSSQSSTCIIASGSGFADALSISPYAYANKAPIYLTEGNATVSSKTLNAIKKTGYKRVVIVGGTSVVSPVTEGALKSIGITNVKRLGGAHRYETSKLIASWAKGEGMSVSCVGVACGANFPDALSGAALCGKNNSVLVLADASNTSNVSDFISSNKASITKGYVFGGEAAVSKGVWDSLPKQ